MNCNEQMKSEQDFCVQGFFIVNLAEVAHSAENNVNMFWNALDEKMFSCHEAFKGFHNATCEKRSERNNSFLGGKVMLTLGYCGLRECVFSLIKKELSTEEGEAFAREIIHNLCDYAVAWEKDEVIGCKICEMSQELIKSCVMSVHDR